MAAPFGNVGLRNKVRFAVVNGVLVEQVFSPDNVISPNTMIHQEPLRIVKSRNWVQIGCTRMDWAAYDQLIREIGEDQ